MGRIIGAGALCLLLLSSAVRADQVVHAISGEPTHDQPSRPDDAADPLDPVTQTYFSGHPIDDRKVILRGTKDAEEFLIRTYISGKPAIVAQHVGDDDVVDWNGVAGENNNAHDHWVDWFGTVQINQFGDGDTLRVQGHTVALNSLTVVDGDTIIVVQSQQGAGGGAHDEDILGVIKVTGVELTEADVTFTHTNDGLTETFSEFLTLVAYWDALYDARRGNRDNIKRRP